MPDWRRRKPIVISPRVGGILGCLATAVIAYGAITVIDQGRSTVPAQWALAVTAGAGTSFALIALIAASAAVARWRRRESRVAARAVMGLMGALALITWAGLHVVGDGGAVGSPWEVGLSAFVLPVACLAVVFIPLFTWRRRSPGPAQAQPEVRRLLMATITARGDRWSVHWTSLGRTPKTLRAPTLTAATDQALTAASALQTGNATELRMVIYPGPYRGGPSFDITGQPGDLTAACTHRPGETFHSGTLEDLADSIKQTRTDSRKGFHLRWTRQITAPAAPIPPPRERQPTPQDHHP